MKQSEANKKNRHDTGGGCSICGEFPAINVEGTYWLCGGCVLEKSEDMAKLQKSLDEAKIALSLLSRIMAREVR